MVELVSHALPVVESMGSIAVFITDLPSDKVKSVGEIVNFSEDSELELEVVVELGSCVVDDVGAS